VPGTSEPLQAAQARFRQIIERPDEDLDLAEAALLIAKTAYHDLDVRRYLGLIDELGRGLRARVPEDARAGDLLIGLNQFLFEEQGFGPNLDDYYDPRNSFLNDVLERRVGIPISLSVLYMEVGRRAGLELQGVSFPGHFLVKCQLEQGVVIVDPYCGGLSLRLQDLQARLREARGGEVSRAIVAGMLVSANKQEILTRMLRNLKAIYLERQDYTHALAIIDWIIALKPGEAAEVRDRGLTYLKLECFRAALEDLERYLGMARAAEDLNEIRGCVVGLRRSTARLN
jgi:regulator of sirC expression with transglutaminase-like and TPR domain